MAMAGAAGLAGCTGGDGGGTPEPEDTPTVIGGGGDGTSTPSPTPSTPAEGPYAYLSKLNGVRLPQEEVEWVFPDVEQIIHPESITAWNLGSPEGDPASVRHHKEYENRTGVKVNMEVIPPGDVLSKARAQLSAESGRVDNWSGDWPFVLNLSAQGGLEDLSPFISEENFNGWVPGAQKVATHPIADNPDFADFPYREGIYMTPWFSSGWLTWTQMNVLEAAGLSRDDNPETFTEFREMAEQLADVDGVQFPVQFPFSGFIGGLPILYDLTVRSGGVFFEDGDPVFSTNDGFLRALDFLLGLVRDGLASKGVTSLTEGQAATSFFEGKAGLQFQVASNMFLPGRELPIDDPPWTISAIHRYPVPEDGPIAFDEDPTGNLFEVMGMMPIYSKKKAATAAHLSFIASQHSQAIELAVEGNTPLREDVFETDIVKNNVPPEYTEPMRRHLGGYDKLIHQQPAKVADVVLREVQDAMANDRATQRTADRIQSAVEEFAK